MSRGNDGLPMLPPWLSESEVTQSGYEAPVQNLPHDELIEDSPSRRRGRFKNRSPEAERPDAARPEKRRKGWRRDKHEGPADDDRQLTEAARVPGPDVPVPGPDVPAPGQRPPDAWGQPGHDYTPLPQESTPPAPDNSWGAPPQRNALPQSSLPTRNPSQPSPGFQPLGSRAAEQPSAQQAPAPQRRPDLPPPPPLPDPPRQAVEEPAAPAPHDEPARSAQSESGPGQANGTGRPPFAPQPGGGPSTGNPRLDAALSAVRPSQWPGTLPPGQQTPPTSSGQPVAPPTSPNPGWPAGADPAAPSAGDPPTQPPPGGQPTAPAPGTDQAARQSAGSPAPTAAPQAGADPAARTSAPAAGNAPAQGRHDQPATPTDPAAGSEGPPPWLAGPRPEDAEASAPGAPRRLPPLPDPPAPHERPDQGVTGTQAPSPTHDERRPSPRGADGPPPWLGHSAPEQAGQSSASGLPPAPNETAAPGVQTPTDPAPEQRSTSNAWPTDSGATGTPAAAPTPGPHAGPTGVGAVPPVPGNAFAASGPGAVDTTHTNRHTKVAPPAQ
ncbi:hypothetical protein [Nocardia gipuzkoensis]|uniref:hypothetical protein n=1 Tax=Nocardia gipuzkoensis TaxID=2749991 RepID=UPI002454F0F1|nr:hypothetical protein [Nocardia gipuzkoensis]